MVPRVYFDDGLKLLPEEPTESLSEGSKGVDETRVRETGRTRIAVRVGQLEGEAADQWGCRSVVIEPIRQTLEDEAAKSERMELGTTTEGPRVGVLTWYGLLEQVTRKGRTA